MDKVLLCFIIVMCLQHFFVFFYKVRGDERVSLRGRYARMDDWSDINNSVKFDIHKLLETRYSVLVLVPSIDQTLH